MKYKTEEQLIEILRKACEAAGSQKLWAKSNGVSEQYVCDILKKRREISGMIAKKLGYILEPKRFRAEV